MTAVATDSLAETFKTLLAAATKRPVLDLDDAKSTTATSYTEVYLSPRFGGPALLDGMADGGLYRLSTRVVADTVTNGRLIEDRIAGAFRFATVDLGGGLFTHVAYESGGGDFDDDDGKWTALTDWTFSL